MQVKRSFYCLAILLIATQIVFGQTVKDKDGNAYETIKIGSQTWFAENLKVSHYRNGDLIPQAKSVAEWEDCYKNEKGAWCFYNNDSTNGKKYGRLYNWYAVNDKRGIAPEGWHVPTDNEWQTLVSTVGGQNSAFSKLSNTSGFNALAGGHRYYKDSEFYHQGVVSFWWSATKADSYNAWYHAMHFSYKQVGRDNGGMNTGFSIRCVKN